MTIRVSGSKQPIAENGSLAQWPARVPAGARRSAAEWSGMYWLWMRGRVVNKVARWNNCFGDTAQEPDYEAGKGTVIAFSAVPRLRALREALPRWFGAKAKRLVAETNDYMDNRKCGIGYHGDSERRIVVCARFGATMPLVFQWFRDGQPVGAPLRLDLADGDVYAMSQKATGFDWKRRSILTLRHAAGARKYIDLPKQTSAPAGAAWAAAAPAAPRRAAHRKSVS
jgi:hypothetical protein